MSKPYKLGITVGRFQTFHNGHKDMLEKALELCETVGVFIGSSQESGTNKNPYTFETRKEIIKKVFGDRVMVCPLPDIGVGNNSKWGDYVLENVVKYFGRYPDLLISGKEQRRIDWFDSVNGNTIAELYVPKTIDISASRMREMLADGDFETLKEFTDERLWDSFEYLRNIVLNSKSNDKTDSM